MPLNPTPNYPTSLDSLPDPTSSTFTDDDGFELDLLLQKHNAILELLEQKLGISASTPATNGDVLYVTGAGATIFGPRAMVRLAEVTLASAAAQIDFTSIPQTYRHLLLVLNSKNNTTGANIFARFATGGGGFDSGANYDYHFIVAQGTTFLASPGIGQTSTIVGQQGAASNVFQPAIVWIADYTSTTRQKSTFASYSRKDGTTGGSDFFTGFLSGYWRNTGAIDGIRLFPGSDSFDTGTRATLYGIPS